MDLYFLLYCQFINFAVCNVIFGMRLKNSIILAAAVSALALSCGKSNKTPEEELPYLSGSVSFSAPLYVLPGEKISMKASGASAADGSEVRYTWYVSPKPAVRDTADSYEFEAIDSLIDLSITCTAFADGYYSIYKSATVKIVDPERSLVREPFDGVQTETDERDGETIEYVNIGSKSWMSKNLAYNGSGVSFSNPLATNPIYGRYYTWTEAGDACPQGWRLPSQNDLTELFAVAGNSAEDAAGGLMVKSTLNGEDLWEFWPDVIITNKSGFSALPTGYAIYSNGQFSFEGIQKYAVYWTSDVVGADTAEPKGVYFYFHDGSPKVFMGEGYVDYFAASVRCVRDNGAQE